MRDFRQLKVWHKAHEFVLNTYRSTKTFPSSERFVLTSQSLRAAISIPANIAQGCGRDTEPDLARFLTIAMGSASEAEYLVLLARDLGYLKDASSRRLIDQITESSECSAHSSAD